MSSETVFSEYPTGVCVGMKCVFLGVRKYLSLGVLGLKVFADEVGGAVKICDVSNSKVWNLPNCVEVCVLLDPELLVTIRLLLGDSEEMLNIDALAALLTLVKYIADAFHEFEILRDVKIAVCRCVEIDEDTFCLALNATGCDGTIVSVTKVGRDGDMFSLLNSTSVSVLLKDLDVSSGDKFAVWIKDRCDEAFEIVAEVSINVKYVLIVTNVET